MQQFRLVLLDDYDNVIGVEYESEVFSGNDKFDLDGEPQAHLPLGGV